MTVRKRTIALVPFALLMLLASCGGGGKSSKETVSVAGATGPSGATSALAPQGTSPTAPRPSTTQGGKKARGSSPSSPSSPSSSPASKRTALRELQRKAAALEKKLNKGKKKKKGGTSPSKPTPKPSSTPQDVLARKAKRVCESAGVQALATRYKVEPTAEAVATAYAASYPPTFRTAVHDGCKSAFPGQ